MDVELQVLPAHRRRGVGRALFALARERAGEQGRNHLIGPTTGRHPDGAAFAGAMGALAGLEENRSRLDLHTADQGRLDALLAEAWTHADGYRLVQWIGMPPDEIIDDVAYLDSRLRPMRRSAASPGNRRRWTRNRMRATELQRDPAGPRHVPQRRRSPAAGWSPGRRSPGRRRTRRTPGRTSPWSTRTTAVTGSG